MAAIRWRALAKDCASSRTFKTIAKSAAHVQEADGQPCILERELPDKAWIPCRPCPIGERDQLVERVPVRFADRSNPTEITRSRDQRSAHLPCLHDAAVHDVPIEHDEGGQLDPPRVQHVAAGEGLLPRRLFQATQCLIVDARQEPGHVGTNRSARAHPGSSWRAGDRTARRDVNADGLRPLSRPGTVQVIVHTIRT